MIRHLFVLLALAATAYAQAPDVDEHTGYIGKDRIRLEIDDCKQLDPAASEDERKKIASEHYQRGETLYLQGDYDGAVDEFVAAYCTVPFFRFLKDIGQAYERSLDYEKAMGYLERYMDSIPPDAKRANDCAVDPQEDKKNIERRLKVLEKLPSRIYVGTTPKGATITLGNDSGARAHAMSGEQMVIEGGEYTMTVELEEYETYTEKIEVKIGKPYTYYVQLQPKTGILSVQVTPPDARLFVNDKLVGFGHYEESLPGGVYTVAAESPGRQREEKKIEVFANQTSRELIELDEVPQTGRRQLIGAATVFGGIATGSLLFSFQDNSSIAFVGSVLGAGAGLVGGYFQFRQDLPLGTSNLTITAGVAGSVAGFATAGLFTDDPKVVQPALGAGILVGATAGYLVGERAHVKPGDAALFSSAVIWGTATGSLLSISFEPPSRISSGLILSGLGMGVLGGAMLTRYFDVSRTHAVLIDVGGLVGVIGGLATQSLVYPDTSEGGASPQRLANFSLGGMVIGLITAGFLTRNLDEPNIPVKPTLATATDAGGKTMATYGIVGTW